MRSEMFEHYDDMDMDIYDLCTAALRAGNYETAAICDRALSGMIPYPRDRGLIEFLVEAIGATDEGHVRVERTHDGGLEAVSGDAAVGDVVVFCHGVTG